LVWNSLSFPTRNDSPFHPFVRLVGKGLIFASEPLLNFYLHYGQFAHTLDFCSCRGLLPTLMTATSAAIFWQWKNNSDCNLLGNIWEITQRTRPQAGHDNNYHINEYVGRPAMRFRHAR
jgi:hypothetical protein